MQPRYIDEFKREAVKQVTVNGYEIKDTANRLGIHPESLRSWIKKFESLQNQEELSDKLRIKQSHRREKYTKKGRAVLY